MNVSLTDREIEMLLAVCTEYIEVMSEAKDTHDYTEYMIETGLGSAMRKISKHRNGSLVYSKYKTVRSYPEFEEWLGERGGEE